MYILACSCQMDQIVNLRYLHQQHMEWQHCLGRHLTLWSIWRLQARTDTENSYRSKSFADYFASKINRLREAAVAALRSTPPDLLSALPDPPHIGHTIHSLPSVTPCEVSKLLHKSPPKSSSMDTIPTSLLLQCDESFSVIIAHLDKLSFSEGKFPTRFKTASVTSLLKNPSLDKSLPSSYRPI